MRGSPCGHQRGREQCGVTVAELQQLWVQEAVDSMVISLEREHPEDAGPHVPVQRRLL